MMNKLLIKRPKCTKIDEIEEDFISKLPDALLVQILSRLPEADANRTRILSNRWKILLAFLPNLHFVMPFCSSIEEANKFHDSVDQTLDLRGGMPINRFYLYCSKNCNYDRIYDWLCKVVMSKVQELELRFPADRFRVKFCWDLFKTCSSLVSLTLQVQFVLHVPDDAGLLFPCLKKINLVSAVYSGDELFANLISGCPVLEELFVERHLMGRFDNEKAFMVISPSLKRLRFSFLLCVEGDYKVVINAPKLEYLDVLDYMSTTYFLTKPLSLTEAHIKIRTDGHFGPVAQLLTCISTVKILTLTRSTLMAFSYLHGVNMPVFPNLVKFVVGYDVIWVWNKVATLLDKMPNLEHIMFADGLLPFQVSRNMSNLRGSPPVEVPACLRFKMKEIIIDNQEAISPEDFNLLGYLLKHSENLEILRINAHKIEARAREWLLNLYRGSILCRIEFV